MSELLKSLTDDQIALLGCAAALTVAGTIMSLSYYIGRGRTAATKRMPSEPTVLKSSTDQLKPAASRRTAA